MIGRFGMRAVLSAALMFILCAAGYAEGENCPVQLHGSAVLVNAAGEDVIPEGEYGLLYELYGLPEGLTLYAGARADDYSLYALVDAGGKRLTEFDYRLLEYMDGGVLFFQDGKCGVMDEAGRVIIEPEYTWMIPDGGDGYLALKTDPYDDSPDSIYCVTADGAASASGVRIGYGLNEMREGLSAASDPDSGLYGYIGPDGRWAIEPAFRWAGVFQEGRAQADTADGTGLIDRTGGWVIEPRFDSVQQAAPDSLILAAAGETVELMDPETLETVGSCTGSGMYGYAVSGGAVLVMEGCAAIVDRTGDEVVRLEGCLDVSQWEGMENELIAQMGEYGTPSVYLYRKDGSVLAGPYQNIMPLGTVDGEMYYTFVSFDAEQAEYEEYSLTFWDEIPGTRRCGVIAPDGRELCVFDCEYISWADEDRMLIQTEDSILLADFSGNVIREFEGADREEATE